MSRALLLSRDERAHLFRLGDQPLEPARRSDSVPASILHLISFLEEVPAYVLNARYDLLAWNPLASALMGDLDAQPPDNLNVIRWIFSAPDLVDHLGDEEKSRFTRAAVADLRTAVAAYPDDHDIQALVAEMDALSPHFRALWADHEVEVRREQRKMIMHPEVGLIHTICQVLPVPDRDDLRLVLYTAEPGSASHQALRRLREVTLSSLDESGCV